jgi:hypothetical protein
MKTLAVLLLFAAVPVIAKDQKKPQTPPPAAPEAIMPSIDGLPIGSIAKQQMPAKGCAAFLWSKTPSMALIAMVTADPATIRLTIDGRTQDFARTAENGLGGLGFPANSEYQGGDVTATLDMTITSGGDIANGAKVGDATLRIDRPGKDSVIVPVGGLIGCA